MTKFNPNLFKEVKLQNVRLSYPHLFKTTKGYKDQKDPHFSATFLLDKVTHAKSIKEILTLRDQILTEMKLSTTKIDPKYTVIKNGDEVLNDEGEVKTGYRNVNYVNAISYKPISVVNRDKSPVTEEMNLFYGGCYVSAVIVLTGITDHDCVSARLKAVQFVGNGEPFVEAKDYTAMFDVVEDTSVNDLF